MEMDGQRWLQRHKKKKTTKQTTIPSCLTAARAAVDCAAKEIAIATATPNGVWQVQDAGLA